MTLVYYLLVIAIQTMSFLHFLKGKTEDNTGEAAADKKEMPLNQGEGEKRENVTAQEPCEPTLHSQRDEGKIDNVISSKTDVPAEARKRSYIISMSPSAKAGEGEVLTVEVRETEQKS